MSQAKSVLWVTLVAITAAITAAIAVLLYMISPGIFLSF